MIFGARLRILLVLAAGWLATPALAQPAMQPAWGLPQLMAGLARVKSASAQFTEHKTMAVLNAPLVATGTLDYAAPDWMQKITVAPVPERFVLSGQQITMTDGQDQQTHVFSVRQDALIGGLTEGILDTLAGDLTALTRVYDVQFSGGPASWQLVLQPRDPAMRRVISWMCIRGSQNRIGSIATQSANGDHSEMSIAETVDDAR
jgi:outer membrane lipoprotein-sorting protein